VYAALREKEKAFEALNKAYEQHDIPLSAQCNRLLARLHLESNDILGDYALTKMRGR